MILLYIVNPAAVYSRVSDPVRSDALYTSILNQSHTLIAGATGSGKSVLIHGVVDAILNQSPQHCGMILIDPKKVELYQYAQAAHTAIYADEIGDIIKALQTTVYNMDLRYSEMKSQYQRSYTGRRLYVIIDELADLMTQDKRHITPLLTRLTQLGRAAGIHVIAATQRPTRDIINGAISVNFDCRIALRCHTAQDSRNIIRRNGAECLPRFGQCLFCSPDYMSVMQFDVPAVPDEQLERSAALWQEQKPIKKRGLFRRHN